ncbi:MAG: hypothetical protein K2J20_05140 [Bacilli bacterium]|nr:hypothetical protein [Bacilli bacterium]
MSEEEKLKLFEKDFECWIPEAERRYFKLHDYIKIQSLNDFVKDEVFEMIIVHVPDFKNLFYNNHWRYSHVDNFDFDSDGYLRYVHTGDEPVVELELAKIADRVSAEEGREHYEHEMAERARQEEEKRLVREAAKYFKTHQGRFYKLQRTMPNLSQVEFMIMEQGRENELKRTLVRRLNNTLSKRIDDLNN